MAKQSIGILHYSAPPVVGGVEAVIHAQAELFIEAGYPTRLIAGQGEATALPEGAELARLPLLDSRHPQIQAASQELESGNLPEEYAALVNRIAADLRPAIVDLDCLIVHNVLTKHFNLPLTDALFRLLDEGSIRRLVAWCHDFTWTSSHSRSKVFEGQPWDLLRTYRPDVDYVVVSQQRQKELAGLFDRPLETIRVVYNGVDWKSLLGISAEGAALIERLGLLEAGLVVLLPVRVTQAKNIEYSLEVAASLKNAGRAPKMVLTGPPDPHDPESLAYFRSLQALRARLGVEDAMRFVFESGPEPGSAYLIGDRVVGDLFRISDLVFMPSHREGYGMPVLEAGLSGVPVVSAAMPAASEIAAGEAQIFDLAQPAQETARLIVDLLETNPLCRLKRRIRQEYTWQAIFRRQIEPLISK